MYAKNGSNPAGDELRWVIQIRRLLEEELVSEEAEEDGGGIPPTTIFHVPTPWLAGKSECYHPQLVGIGPYHRWRPELLPMDHSKLSAARRVRGELLRRGGPQFQHVVDHLARLEHRLRASYHGCLDCDGETLAWATAIDASFLLGFLQNHLVRRRPSGEASPPSASGGKVPPHLVGSTVGRTCAHDMVLRDLVMLENQIPLWPLRLLLEAQHTQAMMAEELLTEMAAELVKEICPFHMMLQRDPPFVDVVSQSSHLLDLLYNVVVPKQHQRCGMQETADVEVEEAASKGLLRRLSSYLGRASASGPVRFLIRVAHLGLITQLPVLLTLRHSIEHLLSSRHGEFPRPGVGDDGDRPLLAEEIAIPSATELAAAGVKFVPADGGPMSVTFDSATAALRLPAVSLDANTEVTLRNLVAYELSSPAAGPPALARYVELMNGIVDAEEDVGVLRESGVVRNGLRSDGEAAEVWNGMSRQVQLGRVAPLDSAIDGVNRYYHSRWRAKVGRLLLLLLVRRGQGGSEARYSCTALTASVLLLFVVGLHGFCLLHDCGRPKSSGAQLG